MSTESAQPDATANPEAMTLPEIQAELREPNSASVESAEHRERRAQLWRRLDELSGIRRPAAATPTQRGAQRA
jgi:hypothetical protein